MMYEINGEIQCCINCTTPEEKRTFENIRRKAYNLPLIPPDMNDFMEIKK